MKPGSRTGLFLLEGANSFGAALYFNYLFFHLGERFALSERAILAIAALHGAVYTLMSRVAGRLAQRQGMVATFRRGSVLVAASLACGALAPGNLTLQVLVFVGWTLGICLTWPPLQAMATEGQDRNRTARLVGIYNLVWAGLAGVANFVGGGLYDHYGALGILAGPAVLALVLALCARSLAAPALRPWAGAGAPAPAGTESTVDNPRFLALARLANPFAYVAINCLVPMIPALARGLHLTPTQSGWVNSTWFLGRWAAFVILWRWMGWHYRLGWLFSAFGAILAGFLTVVLAPGVWTLVTGQLLFGLGIGLVYYSSLFYSMDAGASKGEHGGLHESAIGAGTFLGPALGAAAITVVPGLPNPVAWVVGALLVAGFACLAIRARR